MIEKLCVTADYYQLLTYDGVCKECVSVIFRTQNKSETTLIMSKPCINQVFRDQNKIKLNF